MFSIRHPEARVVRAHLERQAALPFSYQEVGATRRASDGVVPSLAPGCVIDHNRVRLGEGPRTFALAKRAIQRWEMFNLAWLEFCWPTAPLEVCQVVGIAMRSGPLWSLNACRIVYLLDETDARRDRYGFAYGTLPDHAASGEERFLVEHQHSDDSVWYDLLAFSRPGGLAMRIGSKYARGVQKKFARDSLRAMSRASSGQA